MQDQVNRAHFAMQMGLVQWTQGKACCPHCNQAWPKWRLERSGDYSKCRQVTFCVPDCPHTRYCAPLDDPAEKQIFIRLLRAAGAADQPIVDGPRKKIRKTGASMYSVDCVEFWEKITNQLLFWTHRDADTLWSLLIRYTPATFWLMKTLNLSDAI